MLAVAGAVPQGEGWAFEFKWDERQWVPTFPQGFVAELAGQLVVYAARTVRLPGWSSRPA
jgi:hypothetical protein